MRISQRLLRALEESIDRGWFKYGDLERILGGREEAFYTLLEGYALGLYRLRGEDEFEIRPEALGVLEAWRLAGRPGVDPWVDSRVYTMLRTVGSRGRVPREWEGILGERGLASGGELSGAALKLVAALEGLERGLVLTKGMARSLASDPVGPAEARAYSRFLPVYEAMGLAVGSVPSPRYYSLTLPGRLLRRAVRRLNLDAPFPSVVNPGVIRALEKAEAGGELTPEEKTVLGTLGYLKPTGALDYPGRLVLAAWRALRRATLRPPMALSGVDELVLKSVVEAWREHEEKPNVIPDKERVAYHYARLAGSEHPGIGADIMHLESLGLVEETSVEGKRAYKPTEAGLKLYEAGLPGKGTPAPAVKSITYPYALLAPSTSWVEAGVEHGVVAVGGPTRRGELLARLSAQPRLPLLTRPEARALQRLPEEKPVPREEAARILESEGVDAGRALERLEARGLIETLPDESVALTRAGRLVKLALLGVPEGISTPVYPVLVRVLKALVEIGREDIAEIVNRTKLTLEAVKDALVLARAAKYIGKGGGLTVSGRALLEAAEALAFPGETEGGL